MYILLVYSTDLLVYYSYVIYSYVLCTIIKITKEAYFSTM